MTRISIIVPVYGVEKYLKRCIESLVNQTFEDIEIILINDASPDNCHLIMHEYEHKYPQKIRCIYSKENLKQGGARNLGLKIAKGEYILFVDSDDWADVTMCEKMYCKAKEKDYDIVYCDHKTIQEDNGRSKYVAEVCEEQVGELSIIKKKALFKIASYPFAMLVRSKIIIDNDLLFAEGIKYEDKAIVYFYFLYSKNTGKINESLYFYNIRENSTVRKRNEMYQFDRLTAALLFYNEAKKRGFYEIYKEELDMALIRDYGMMLNYCVNYFDEPPIDRMLEISQSIKEFLPNYQKNYYINKLIEPYNLKLIELNNISPKHLIKEVKKIEEKTSYVSYYTETMEKTKKLFDYVKRNNYSCALWGIGPKGIDFIKVNDSKNTNLNYRIDGDKKKQGIQLEKGYVVTSFESVRNKIDVVLVSNRNHYGEIYNEIKKYNLGISVINLDNYLVFDMDLNDYFNSKI